MAPGVIRYRGYVIEDLIRERASLAQMVWLLTRGELPTRAQVELLAMALMSAVDHGPRLPASPLSARQPPAASG
jgi:citrate synthase